MANFASTVLQDAQAKQISNYADLFQGRPNNSFVMDMFLKTRSITLPNLADIRQADTQTTTTLYQTVPSFTNGSSKSCTPSGDQGDSATVDLTWSTKTRVYQTSLKRHKGNQYSMTEAMAFDLLMMEKDLFKGAANSMETVLISYLDTNRTQYNAAYAGYHNTWDSTNFNMDVANADIASFYNYVLDEMHGNNYTNVAFNDVYNTSWGANIRSQSNQGEANSTNQAFQYNNPFNFDGFASNLITMSTSDLSTHYIVPDYGVAILDWNDPINREGRVLADKEWTLYESRLFPGIMLDLFIYETCSDTSASGGSTQDVVLNYEFAFNYSIVKQPVNESGETPIFKYNILSS